MGARENEKMCRDVYDCFNSRDLDKATSLVAPNVEHVDVPTGERYTGTDGYRQSLQVWIDAFPDAKCDVKRVIASDTAAVAEFIGSGTHRGPLPGFPGAPTGKKISMQFCEITEFQNGKIARSRLYFDLATMMRQLGVGAGLAEQAEPRPPA